MSKIIPPLLIFTIIIITTGPAHAHKLITHDGTHTDFDSALHIPNHRISWAIYDNLDANGVKFYTFEAKHGDPFYASILIPKINGLEEYSPSLFLVSPAGVENSIALLEIGPNVEEFPYNGDFPGNEFYEPFGQVTYWERQEVTTNIPIDGQYYVVVADEGVGGRYALSIGTIEDFSGENFLLTLPMAWFETKLFVNDYFSMGILFSVLTTPAGVAFIIIQRRLRKNTSKNLA